MPKDEQQLFFKSKKFGEIEKNCMCDPAQRLVTKTVRCCAEGIKSSSERFCSIKLSRLKLTFE